MDLFFYGTLRHAPLLRLVLGCESRARTRPAALAGHAVSWAEGQCFPMMHAEPGGTARGVLVTGLSDEDIARLDYYEGGFAYELRDVTLSTDSGPARARAWFPQDGHWTPGDPWFLEDWAAIWGDMTVHAAREVMSYYPQVPAAEVQNRFTMIRMRADSRVRAATPVPASLRGDFGAGDVDIRDARRPYANFFTLEEHDLAFRRFDGTMSDMVNRAGFVGGDAVTVLPYDPVRDRVMVIEQFRFGPHLRGDPNPWVLEPIAGRIDPGESAQATAIREAREEAGLEIGALHHVADYYPTPGAVSEFLMSYIAIADLPDSAAGLGGVDHEAEDIRSHVIPFGRLMELVSTGEAGCGPLVLSAFWLLQNRDRLRGSA
ncbi:gamma-glutamylcyclotransferase [Aliiroseovarius sp.]|uniref:gamma-glutamylcyclotransferase n=1 Tax=Aliiroseovarius sp. TaxID=1872442 RepID=UPI00262A6CFF|nr:gamma-glutamylcyclotransferase [Aliiroseovarius sp.]